MSTLDHFVRQHLSTTDNWPNFESDSIHWMDELAIKPLLNLILNASTSKWQCLSPRHYSIVQSILYKLKEKRLSSAYVSMCQRIQVALDAILNSSLDLIQRIDSAILLSSLLSKLLSPLETIRAKGQKTVLSGCVCHIAMYTLDPLLVLIRTTVIPSQKVLTLFYLLVGRNIIPSTMTRVESMQAHLALVHDKVEQHPTCVGMYDQMMESLQRKWQSTLVESFARSNARDYIALIASSFATECRLPPCAMPALVKRIESTYLMVCLIPMLPSLVNKEILDASMQSEESQVGDLYSLIKYMDEPLQQLADYLYAYVKQCMEQILQRRIERTAIKATTTDHAMVIECAALWQRMTQMVENECDRDVSLVKAIHRSMDEMINRSIEPVAIPILLANSSLCDDVSLDMLVSLFRLLRDKDVYLDALRSLLSKVLLQPGAPMEKVNKLLVALSMETGMSFLEKHDTMLKDAAQDRVESANLIARILKASAWPRPLVESFTLHPSLSRQIDPFIDEYHARNTTRRIKIWEGATRVTIRWMGSHDLVMQLLQANVLLFLADESRPVSIDSLAKMTHLSFKQTADLLAPLWQDRPRIHCRRLVYLVGQESGRIKVSAQTLVAINREFACPMRKITFDPVYLETNVMNDKVKEDRSFIIDAFLCRLLKARKQLTIADMMSEASRQIKVFSPSVRDLKKSIDTLMDREILERDKEDINLLHYVP